MSMEISSTSLVSMASDILEQDADKIITEEEIQRFVSSDTKYVSADIDKSAIVDELSAMFKSDTADAASKTEGSEDPFAEYNRLKAQIEQYNAMLEQYDLKISALTKDTETLQKELDAKIKEYNSKEAELLKENSYLENTIGEIDSTKEAMEADIENRQKRAVWNAINDYDPDTDGDWDKYLQDACEGTVYSPLGSKLNSLMRDSKVTMCDIKNVASGLSKLSDTIGSLSDKISANAAAITQLGAMKETTTTALEKAQQDLNNCILNFVSEAEMQLVTDNNIDLKETMEDGNPRYILAKGKEDGAFLIYDMAQGASLARLYGCDGGGLRGSDIVPCGNGYINGFQYLDDCSENGEEVFWITDCGMQSKKACYSTCSPLEFDLAGDGYQLDTSKTVQFDIDGDGKLDNINDSLDAVLVFDKDGDGISGSDGSECFGNNTDLDNKNGADGYSNGFEALAAMRQKAIDEGVLTDRGDATLNADDLAVLEKNYGLKIKTGGYNSEAVSLSSVGITEIKVSDAAVGSKTQFDSFGNEIQTQQGASFTINGQENSYADMWHRTYSDSEAKNYDDVIKQAGGTTTSPSFDVDKIAATAMNLKLSISSQTASALARTSANEVNLNTTSYNAKKDVNKALGRDFWSGTQEPENFFSKPSDELKEAQEELELQEQEELEAKEQEEKEALEAKEQEELEQKEKENKNK